MIIHQNFRTPWNCKTDFDIAGEGPTWGTYSISRNVRAAVTNQVIKLTMSGEASFTRGVFAEDSPIVTDVDLTYRLDNGELTGKFSRVHPFRTAFDGAINLLKQLQVMAEMMNFDD